jgi:GT2 family glycosyltransferase
VYPDTLNALVAHYTQSAHPTLVGGVLYHPDGQFQQVATQVNLWTGSSKGYTLAELEKSPQVDSLTGACMLIPKAVFNAIGLLPEKHFLYFEDVAFCLSARRAGFTCVVAPEARISHALGLTTNAMPERRSYYYHRNRWQVCWQFGHGLQRVCLIGYGGVRLLRSMVKVITRSSYAPHHRVFMLALGDALKGVSGPCPHRVLM